MAARRARAVTPLCSSATLAARPASSAATSHSSSLAHTAPMFASRAKCIWNARCAGDARPLPTVRSAEPAPAVSRNAAGNAAVDSSRPLPRRPSASASMRICFGSTSGLTPSLLPTSSRPSAPRPSLLSHLIAAAAPATAAGRVSAPTAPRSAAVVIECMIQPQICVGTPYKTYGRKSSALDRPPPVCVSRRWGLGGWRGRPVRGARGQPA